MSRLNRTLFDGDLSLLDWGRDYAPAPVAGFSVAPFGKAHHGVQAYVYHPAASSHDAGGGGTTAVAAPRSAPARGVSRSVAIHEAGHAVAVLACGGDLESVSVEHSDELNAAGHAWWFSTWNVDTPQGALRRAVVTLAGPCAEDAVHGSAADMFRHIQEARADLARFYRPGSNLSGALGTANDVANDLVRDNRAAIELLAEALLERGTLDGREIRDLVTVRRLPL